MCLYRVQLRTLQCSCACRRHSAKLDRSDGRLKLTLSSCDCCWPTFYESWNIPRDSTVCGSVYFESQLPAAVLSSVAYVTARCPWSCAVTNMIALLAPMIWFITIISWRRNASRGLKMSDYTIGYLNFTGIRFESFFKHIRKFNEDCFGCSHHSKRVNLPATVKFAFAHPCVLIARSRRSRNRSFNPSN
jgi:hypothetical protein